MILESVEGATLESKGVLKMEITPTSAKETGPPSFIHGSCAPVVKKPAYLYSVVKNSDNRLLSLTDNRESKSNERIINLINLLTPLPPLDYFGVFLSEIKSNYYEYPHLAHTHGLFAESEYVIRGIRAQRPFMPPPLRNMCRKLEPINNLI
jgi:hypothetical protein